MSQGSRIDGRIIIKDVSRDDVYCSFEERPKHGKSEVTTNGYWSYIPNKSFIGIEEFKIKVNISGVGTKYSTITIDVQEQELSSKISKFLQFEQKLKIDNYDDEIVEIKNIELVVDINNKKIIKNDFNHTSKLILKGSLKYLIYYDVGIVPVKRRSFWLDDELSDTEEFIPEKEVVVEKKAGFNTVIELDDLEVEDEILIESEIKYQNYRLMNYEIINHYCAIELYINK
jgi:hypothetical protein